MGSRAEGMGIPTVMAEILDKKYRLNKQSTLKSYLEEKIGLEEKVYTFREFLTMMKKIISKDRNFDMNNPEMILCSKPLEEALDQKVLHVTQLPAIMLSQMQPVKDEGEKTSEEGIKEETTLEENATTEDMRSGNAQVATRATLIEKTGEGLQTKKTTLKDILEDRFVVKGKLAELLGVRQDPEEEVTLTEVVQKVQKYAEERMDTMLDKRNTKIIITRGDPLGEVLGVKALHVYQIGRLVMKHVVKRKKKQRVIVIRSNTDVEMTLELGQ